MRTLSEPTGLASLTEHQRTILRLYIELGSYKAVAYMTGVHISSVKHTAALILRRLDVSSITAACILLDRAER